MFDARSPSLRVFAVGVAVQWFVPHVSLEPVEVVDGRVGLLHTACRVTGTARSRGHAQSLHRCAVSGLPPTQACVPPPHSGDSAALPRHSMQSALPDGVADRQRRSGRGEEQGVQMLCALHPVCARDHNAKMGPPRIAVVNA